MTAVNPVDWYRVSQAWLLRGAKQSSAGTRFVFLFVLFCFLQRFVTAILWKTTVMLNDIFDLKHL